jgi:hypothetical protein
MAKPTLTPAAMRGRKAVFLSVYILMATTVDPITACLLALLVTHVLSA